MNRRAFLRAVGLTGLATGLATLAATYAVVIERTRVQVNRYRVPVADLPAAFRGFTIAQLTDVHFGPLVSESFVAGVVDRTNRLRTDMIVCTGDSVHTRDTTEEIDRVWPLLARLQAEVGVYSVLGNHDHWADFDRSRYWLERTGQDLRHRCRIIHRGKDRLFIAGAGDLWEDRLRIDEAFACSEERACRLHPGAQSGHGRHALRDTCLVGGERSYPRRSGGGAGFRPADPSRQEQGVFERPHRCREGAFVHQPWHWLVDPAGPFQLCTGDRRVGAVTRGSVNIERYKDLR